MTPYLRWACLVCAAGIASAAETVVGPGLSEANKERVELDSQSDSTQWYNGSPEETQLSSSAAHVKQGSAALKFANVVDHTKGEKAYPVGWPRAGTDLAKMKLTDWSAFDLFECWIYTETSRDHLPNAPLTVGFYHSGPKRSTSVPLNTVKKDQWVKFAIPVSQIEEPQDVQRIQFSISEANYRHGDRIDFYIDDPVLTRYVQPAIASFELDRKIMYADETYVVGRFTLAGHQGLETTRVQLTVGPADRPVTSATTVATRTGEITAKLSTSPPAGLCEARLDLRDTQGRLLDRSVAQFRVLGGPF
jgi:hypothetical protein